MEMGLGKETGSGRIRVWGRRKKGLGMRFRGGRWVWGRR